MWWLFVQKSESSKRVIYSYSRNSENLDGIVIYDKRMEEAYIFDPCREDMDSYKDRNVTLGHFFNYVVDRAFPERKKVSFRNS